MYDPIDGPVPTGQMLTDYRDEPGYAIDPIVGRTDMTTTQDEWWAAELESTHGSVTIDGAYFRLLDGDPDSFREGPDTPDLTGLAGARFRLRHLATGEIIETRLLVFIGNVPHKWLGSYPNTHDFVSAREGELDYLAREMLATFIKTSDGHRARVGQVQIARWQAVLGGAS